MHNRTDLTEHILENLDEGVLVVSPDGNIVYINKAIEDFLGLQKNLYIGKPLKYAIEQHADNSGFYQLLTSLCKNHEDACDCASDFTHDSNTFHIRIRTTFLKEFGIIFLFEDITKLTELRLSTASLKKLKSRTVRLENRNKFLADTFGRYLSDEIVREITCTPDGLELGGKTVNLTVLMSDIRGSTSIADSMDANKYLLGLNHYLEEMTDVIHKYKGTVIEFIGDSILAIFGTPIPCDNHALQAVGAAIEMQKRMEQVNEWNKTNGFPAWSMGIGINTGDVILGNIGSARHTKYGVTGYIVNLCSRIESYALGGQILTGDYTVSRINSSLRIRSKISVFPKGSTSPFSLYDIYGVGDPFNISIDTYKEKLTELESSIPIRFSVIHGGKNVELETHSARITHLSTTNAIIETATPLEQHLDLQFKLSSNSIVYCKVTKVKEVTAHLAFTSVPATFFAWCSSLTMRFSSLDVKRTD